MKRFRNATPPRKKEVILTPPTNCFKEKYTILIETRHSNSAINKQFKFPLISTSPKEEEDYNYLKDILVFDLAS